ncbi:MULTISPECIES: hypothetical protein [Streptomyces]|uniref:DUF4268 domain-containing protein n=1 Tax=Streptomyces tsukubensis (strain DSM 42081 / NBRC 108919 / NRRL 18488 / 9993) TaxID=1114943 RepID=I2N7X6_STRT9|nr:MULTISPECIES: hypothetical protein [Streptomyces]AZK97041.1 hypothetical protein B7R87_26600 [Streptomyces tsukubensis]EIF93123.1 hypothetical protein [Streptomyces tsukubensis NRRL18488]MYS66519.1 hypothetical protein [Streptomyces sp. SID5473]QKM66985.1 hypothetical protein STSU_007180 [Streptomyces tsukubensis NRRL18488]TAI41538.1 hypothetical protein EWI31_27270 [Streptomyces tsukubensis]
MITDTSPALDWTMLGQSFAAAHAELDSSDYLLPVEAGPEKTLPLQKEVVDAAEPEGADEKRTQWLRAVDNIRTYFGHEATNFTPWLARRLGIVQRAAWFENPLKLVGTEQKIAGYRIDILAKTQVGDRDRFVVIENQLERTDADHLGRLITCAAEVEASHAVWISAEFRDDHLKVMEALQQHHRDCSFIPLLINGAVTDGGCATFDLVPPPTYPSPEDHLRERLHLALRQARDVHMTLKRVGDLISANPEVDFTRYRRLITEAGLWSYYADGLADGLLETIPEERRKQPVS